MDSSFKIVELSKENLSFAPQIAEFIYSVLESAGVPRDKYSDVKEETTVDYISRNYGEKNRFWVALDGDTVIGTIALHEIDEKTGELKRMLVDPKFHGKGLGKVLLDTLLIVAKERGYSSIILYSDMLMTRAHRFYEKNGFLKTKEYPDYFAYEKRL